MDLVDVVEVVSAVLRQLIAPYGNHKKKEDSPYGELCFIRKEIIRAEKIIKDLGENKNFYTYDEPKVWKDLLDLVYKMEDFAETVALSRRLHLIRRPIFILRQMLNLKALRKSKFKIDGVIGESSLILHMVSRPSYSPEESDVVGLEEEKTKMVTWLTDTNSHPNLGFILISGKTGSGKTTLAKEICKSPKIESHFESCQWVSASDDPVSNLRSILQKVSTGHSKADMESTVTELEEKICKILKNKRCLVVVDNVQSPYLFKTSPVSGLSDKGKGSRVIMTMRESDVVGLEEEKTKMVTWLTDTNSRPNLGVILISGKTGSGKTTLAKEICKSPKIESHFKSCQWVSASDDPVSNLQSILQKVSTGHSTVDMEFTATELEEKICKILKNERHLVVVDNVQSPYLFKTRPGSALSDEGTGSRVIMTMRSKYDAGQMKRTENKDKFDVEQSLTGQEESKAEHGEQNKKWLLVFDKDKDKAKINYHFKARSGSALAGEGNGRKVIMTVRSKDVAGQMKIAENKDKLHVEHSLTDQQRDLGESQPRNEDESSYSASEGFIKLFMDERPNLFYHHELQPLQDEDAWCLFNKDNNVHSSDLEKFKSKIIAICRGIPSAIVVLGRFLWTKECKEWLTVLDQHPIEGNEVSVSRLSTILALMNSDLTFGLRPCLFYFVLFKKECEIPVRRLLLLWVAEGLIVTDHPNPEETAERILTYFTIKGIIEIVQLRKDGDPKTCRMPGIVYDICLSKAEDILGLLHINATSTDHKSTAVSREFGVRRVAEHSDIKNYSCNDHSRMRHLRSYVSFNARNEDTPVVEIGDFLSEVIGHRGFGLLRVLDLERVYKPKLPDNLGKLYQLRYLGLRWTFLDTLPHSVSKLSCLQTLDVKHTYISSLPNTIWKMEDLRHLWLNEIRLDVKKHSISLKDHGLQTLWGLFVDNETPVKNGLDKLKKLKKLGLTFHLAFVDELNEWIKSLKGLQSLRLRSKDKNGRPSKLETLESLSGLENLTNLYLLGKLPELKDGCFPKSLAVLTLSVSKLEKDPMPILEKLPKLSVLGLLADSYTGKEMVCHRGGFPKLRILKLWMLNELETWTVKEGAMPDLNELEIRCCCNLKALPDKLLNLSSIDKIILTNMQKKFEDNVKVKFYNVIVQDDVKQETSGFC